MTERTRVRDRVPADVVIEINENFFKLRLPAANRFRPMAQLGVGIVPTVSGPATVKADVDEIRSELLWPGHFAPVVDAQSNIMASQQV